MSNLTRLTLEVLDGIKIDELDKDESTKGASDDLLDNGFDG